MGEKTCSVPVDHRCNMKKLEGKITLVTGGTSGIGLATAKLFHDEGAHVIVTRKNRVTFEVARASLRGIAEVVPSDSRDAVEIQGLFARVPRNTAGSTSRF